MPFNVRNDIRKTLEDFFHHAPLILRTKFVNAVLNIETRRGLQIVDLRPGWTRSYTLIPNNYRFCSNLGVLASIFTSAMIIAAASSRSNRTTPEQLALISFQQGGFDSRDVLRSCFDLRKDIISTVIEESGNVRNEGRCVDSGTHGGGDDHYDQSRDKQKRNVR